MKAGSTIRSATTGSVSARGKLKILLLIFAFAITAGTLWYTHQIVQALNKQEKSVADLYARSIEYITNGKTGDAGDYSFIFSEINSRIDFPIIITDKNNVINYPFEGSIKNIELDSALSRQQQEQFLNHLVAEMDHAHSPIVVAYQDTIVLQYVHFGESAQVTSLRRLPYIELALAALFVLIGYISFSYIKRNEQSNIWVGMARETAHQLGTPISSMLGWTELLKDQSAGDPKKLETLNDMENDLHRLQKIADRFSKIGSKPDLRKENLVEVIGTIIEYFQRRIPQTGKKVQLVLESSAPVTAHINRELFEWVIENLTKNALDAIETGVGTISYALTQQGKHVFIDVSDTGKGIHSKHRNEVFRPGFSTKKRGWGLGLSLSKRIVESYHHGKLSLKDSKPGFKTTFRIKLNA
jgi:signal transduction histidine kinase